MGCPGYLLCLRHACGREGRLTERCLLVWADLFTSDGICGRIISIVSVPNASRVRANLLGQFQLRHEK